MVIIDAPRVSSTAVENGFPLEPPLMSPASMLGRAAQLHSAVPELVTDSRGPHVSRFWQIGHGNPV